jgi:glycosyltransferase involved in cell wall biosynthesis
MNISIIVPVYNVEKYLARCLDSIFNQQFSGTFEVIAVEDGSTDSSLEILKEYQKRETSLKIIQHETNKRLSKARATGMNCSSGEYIMHVDSDDWLLPNSLEKIYNKCIYSQADVLVFDYVIVNSLGKKTFANTIKKELSTTNKLKVQQHFYGAVWNKIVKRSLTKSMISGEISVNNNEDLLYSTEMLIRAEEIYLISESYYAYFLNADSLSNIIKPKQYLTNQAVILNQLKKILERNYTNAKITNNTLDFFEKWIYLELAKMHFWYKTDFCECNNLIGEFLLFPKISKSRILRLKLSIKNKYINLIEVVLRFGLKKALWLILQIFKNEYK